ncbi:MAG: DUF4403 family protein [Gemmatimonadales bacterium]
MWQRSTVRQARWLAAFALAGCGGDRVMAPPPDALFSETSAEAPPALPATIVNVPLLVDLETAIELLEEALPTQFGDIDDKQRIPGNRRAHFAFAVRRDPFKVSVSGDTFHIATTIHYQGRGWYKPPIAPEVSGSCGIDGQRPRARLTISIRPEIDRNWKLVAQPRLTYLGRATRTERDQCEVTFLKLDVTGRVIDAARNAVRAQLPRVSAKLATLDVRSEIEKVWNEIQKPIRLTDSVWLLLQPEAVRLSQLAGTRRIVGGTVGISARPKIETGPEPPFALKPLPTLGDADSSTGLNLLVQARFEYSLIGASLTEELAGTTINTPGGTVRLEELAAFGIGNGRLALGVKFGGTTSGLIYFVGTPKYDRATGRVSVPDLDYDASTTPLLVKGLAWLKADEIRDYLRSKATFPSADAMEQLADLAEKGMNRELTDGIFLNTTLSSTDVIRILPRRDALYLQAHAIGQAALHVTDQFFAKFEEPVDSSATADSTSKPVAPGSKPSTVAPRAP